MTPIDCKHVRWRPPWRWLRSQYPRLNRHRHVIADRLSDAIVGLLIILILCLSGVDWP